MIVKYILINNGSESIVLSSQAFSITARLTDGDRYRFEEIFNDGIEGEAAEEVAQFFETLADMIRGKDDTSVNTSNTHD